jgi:hypothetical protein
MPDVSDKIRSFLEKMMRVVPGYAGYADKEGRRNSDKVLRMFLAGILQQTKGTYDAFVAELTTKPGGMDFMTAAGSVAKGLEKAIDRLKFADYGYTGFFDAEQVKEPQLDMLYQFDRDLAGGITDLRLKVEQLSAGNPGVGGQLQELQTDLRRLDARLDGRHDVICSKAG